MSDRRVFESLCVDPGRRGFSYDSALLVDVDRALDFDEAVIRLTTKCNSIITQLRTLGHHITEFSVTATKVSSFEPISPASSTIKAMTCGNTIRCPIISGTNTPDSRNLKVMEEQWCGLKQKNYSGMVAVARLSRSSIPRNGSGGRYSVRALTEALLGHIQAYFMFQSYSPDFQCLTTSEMGNKIESAGDEYLIYLVYRIQPLGNVTVHKRIRRQSELKRLEINWPFAPSMEKRRRRCTSGESSISSTSSSTSSNTSGGSTCMTPPVSLAPCLVSQIAATTTHGRHSARSLNPGCTVNDGFGLDLTNWSTPSALKAIHIRSTEHNLGFHKTPMNLRSRKREILKKSTRLKNAKASVRRPQHKLSARRLP